MVKEIDMGDVEKELTAYGFAVREGTLRDVSLASTLQRKWKQLTQKGGAKESLLRPMHQTQAPSRTLSKIHGLGAQPLHTDGSHLKRMPDVIVLSAPNPSQTATVVWKLPISFPSSLRNGVFTVRGNEGAFLAHAFANQRLRFDPGCMSPADHLAKEAVAFFEDVRGEAHTHDWSQGGTLLFINNKKALHGREALVDDADSASRVIARAVYSLEMP